MLDQMHGVVFDDVSVAIGSGDWPSNSTDDDDDVLFDTDAAVDGWAGTMEVLLLATTVRIRAIVTATIVLCIVYPS
jgi:hypothetical protein